jgi:hypothetical protein
MNDRHIDPSEHLFSEWDKHLALYDPASSARR